MLHKATIIRDTDAEIAAAVADERERCAKIADERAAADTVVYKVETDWRQPYAWHRVVRASMDIAASIRNPTS